MKKSLRPALPFAICTLFLVQATAEHHGKKDPPLQIGTRLELFVDDHLIQEMEGVELRLQTPVPAGTVLTLDRPWEGGSSTYTTVFPDGDGFRMYYRGSAREQPFPLDTGKEKIPDHNEVTCVAESQDGVHWTRPSLGVHEFGGSRDNNIVWVDEPGEHRLSYCMAVFKDTNPQTPDSQRYKALGGCSYPLVPLVSEDGYHWKKLRGEESLLSEGLHSNAFDALSSAFWDPVREQYTLIFRDMDRGKSPVPGTSLPPPGDVINYGIRSFKYTSSTDFRSWTYPQWADFGDTPPEHLYTNGVTPYVRAPHIYLALPKRFEPWRRKFDGWTPGVSEGVFLSSRDGVHWDRRFMEAFVRPGRDPFNWGHRGNMAAVGVLQTAEDELSLYYQRNYGMPTAHMERLTLRVDGFVSVHAGVPGGEFVTRPITLEGESLVLNYSTSAAGSIRVEIQDEQGRPIPGFELSGSPLIWGDEIKKSIVWKRPQSQTDRSPFKRLKGAAIRLRFHMKDADLYSLRFR